MYKFLETYNLPQLNQKELENPNSQISPNETESVLKKSPNKNSELDGFIGEFYQTFWEELTPLLLKLFQKIKEEGRLPN